MNKVKFAVLGSGFIGKKHQFFIEREEQAELIATIDEKVEADYVSLHDFITAKPEVDVVCVTTPNALHAEHAIALLNAGYHVVVEKPMALRYKAAEQMRRAAEDAGKQIFIVMQNRYSPAAKWLKDIVGQDRLGELFMVQVNCFWNRDERYYNGQNWHGTTTLDGGSLYTQFSHFIDLLYWCFGEITDHRSNFFDFNHQTLTEFEDSGMLEFRFKDGGAGQFNFSTSCFQKNLESTITIISSKATIKIGGQYMDDIQHCEIDNYSYEQIEPYKEEFGKYKGNSANHRFVIRNVVDTILGQSQADTSIEDGVAVVKTIEDFYKAGDQ